jgi:DNA polymerase-3 subunit delta
VRTALDAGKPLPLALREARVWGNKEKLLERVAPRLDAAQAGMLVQAAQVCDGLVKGLRHPDWPSAPWAALRRLALMLAEAASGKTGVVLAAR